MMMECIQKVVESASQLTGFQPKKYPSHVHVYPTTIPIPTVLGLVRPQLAQFSRHVSTLIPRFSLRVITYVTSMLCFLQIELLEYMFSPAWPGLLAYACRDLLALALFFASMYAKFEFAFGI